MELSLLDKIKRLVIVALVSDDELMETLVLKGGNAISIAYEVGNRGSADLDFSMAGDFADVDAAFAKIEAALVVAFAEEDLCAFDVQWAPRPKKLREDLKSFWGGYELKFKITHTVAAQQHAGNRDQMRRTAIALDEQHNRTFSVDISPYEYCELKIEKTIAGYTYYVYSPQLVVFEKLRAICQQMPAYRDVVGSHASRGRARDFYDIYELMQAFDIDTTSPSSREALRQVFGAKRVPESYLANLSDFRELHRLDYKSVEANVPTASTLKGYDFYFNYVATTFSQLLG